MKFLILFFLVCSTSAHAYPQCEMGGWLDRTCVNRVNASRLKALDEVTNKILHQRILQHIDEMMCHRDMEKAGMTPECAPKKSTPAKETK